jgi:hypothetical protein
LSAADAAFARLVKAPENFLSKDGIRSVLAEGRARRRDFIRSAFDATLAGTAAPAALAQSNPVPIEGDDANILNLPAHSTGLGLGVWRQAMKCMRSSRNRTVRCDDQGFVRLVRVCQSMIINGSTGDRRYAKQT